MLRPTRKDISNALLAWYDITFDEYSGMVEAYYTIIHDEKHPIDPRSKRLEQDIRRNVSSFCDRMRRNLEGTDMAEAAPTQLLEDFTTDDLYNIITCPEGLYPTRNDIIEALNGINEPFSDGLVETLYEIIHNGVCIICACVIMEKGMAYARERIREAVKLYFSGAPEDCRREQDSITELLLRILPLFEN
jgi:hypothetical protein